MKLHRVLIATAAPISAFGGPTATAAAPVDLTEGRFRFVSRAGATAAASARSASACDASASATAPATMSSTDPDAAPTDATARIRTPELTHPLRALPGDATFEGPVTDADPRGGAG